MDTSFSITICDETASGKKVNELTLHFPSHLTTVKQIVELRVRSEVAAYNKRRDDYFVGLVQPSETEKTVNGFKMKKLHEIDVEKQVYVALDAFTKNGYFVLIDHMQAESLEQQIVLTDQSEISFVKLTPLVGG